MNLQKFKKEAEEELISILNYWMRYAIDEQNGGFYGRIDNLNNVEITAPKGAVLNTRILWAFSAAFIHYQKKEYLDTATRAFNYTIKHFIDEECSGMFWTVDSKGNMLDAKKQIYALAFGIYSLSEYYMASQNKQALDAARELYIVIEKHSYDAINKGYFEAFARDWKEADNMRLSAKDANEKKAMNTHLHIIEAYANLYKANASIVLKNKIAELLELFDIYFINKQTFHLRLFFDEAWNEKPDVISYGHDIEAAWLLLRCAEIIDDKKWIETYKQHAIKITDAAAEGIDEDGGMWYECEPLQHTLVKEKHWWVQAEAMVGFFNAYQITNNEKYLQYSINCWEFIKRYIKDSKNGEWFWGVKDDYTIMQNEDKAGLWKCPYHNSRACMEIIKRVDSIT